MWTYKSSYIIICFWVSQTNRSNMNNKWQLRKIKFLHIISSPTVALCFKTVFGIIFHILFFNFQSSRYIHSINAPVRLSPQVFCLNWLNVTYIYLSLSWFLKKSFYYFLPGTWLVLFNFLNKFIVYIWGLQYDMGYI